MVLTFLMIFSLLAQGFATYAKPTPVAVSDHPIISKSIDQYLTTATAETCCDEEKDEKTTPHCSGGDCKLFFANSSSPQTSQADVHSTFLVVEDFSFQNVVRLRPPNA